MWARVHLTVYIYHTSRLYPRPGADKARVQWDGAIDDTTYLCGGLELNGDLLPASLGGLHGLLVALRLGVLCALLETAHSVNVQ
jgi:hypothetical protein